MLTRLFSLSLFLLVYHVLLFPAILLGLARRKGTASWPELDDSDLPSVSLLILARNEEAVIARRIENALAQDYPKEKTQIIVAANGCTDNTAEVARRYEDRGVVVCEYGEVGKTEAQRLAVREAATGEILVFTDANVRFEPDVFRKLARPFQDATVGSVCGNHRFEAEDNPRSQTEGLFWNFSERGLKQLESDSGGMIGANGSIYAVRHRLFRDLPPDVYEDFWQPMLIATRGHRTVYAPDAIAWESVEEPDLKVEHRRKMRIVQQSVAGLIRFRWVMDPVRFPRLSWLVFSHKVLRWGMPFLLVVALAVSMIKMLVLRDNLLHRGIFFGATGLGFLALLGRGLGRLNTVPVLSHAYYAVLMLHAAGKGTIDGFKRGSFSSWDSAR